EGLGVVLTARARRYNQTREREEGLNQNGLHSRVNHRRRLQRHSKQPPAAALNLPYSELELNAIVKPYVWKGGISMFCLRTVSAVFAAGLFLSTTTYAQQTPRATSPATAKDTLNQEDKKFVQEAATGGMAEVELSKIAQK